MWKLYGILGVAAGLTAYLGSLGLPWSIAIGILVSAMPRFLVGAIRGAATPSPAERPTEQMSGTDFEDHVARIARRAGVPVIMTPLTGDWGVDLIVGRRRIALPFNASGSHVRSVLARCRRSSRARRCRTARRRWS